MFVRWGGFARHYRPIWGPFVLKLNAELGVTTSRDPLGVPITERYLVGGIYDIRGLRAALARPALAHAAAGDRRPARSRSLPLGGNMQIICNSEIEFPLFKKVGISGVVFFDMGNAYNLEDRYCSGSSASNVDDLDQVRPLLPAARLDHRRPRASRSASASAGSRRSARCGSSGASRSTRSRARIRWSSSSRSATSSRSNRRLMQCRRLRR